MNEVNNASTHVKANTLIMGLQANSSISQLVLHRLSQRLKKHCNASISTSIPTKLGCCGIMCKRNDLQALKPHVLLTVEHKKYISNV